jgi:uncharacterized coiled-coil DUF342 family protein
VEMSEFESIKKHWEVGNLHSGEIAWLINEVTELRKNNRTLNMEIGSYAGRWQDLVSKMDDITEQMKLLTNNMYIPK